MVDIIEASAATTEPAPSADIRSCLDDSEGNARRYVDELDGDTLTIWDGEGGGR